MTIASCPRCNQMVAVSAAVDDATWVRCPLCQAEFPGSEVLAQLPPPLIILDRPSPQAADLPATAAAPGSAAPPAPETPASGTNLVGCKGPSATDEAEAPLLDFESPVADTRRNSTRGALQRLSRPRKKLAVELAKVAAGGAVGCALAVLILWWTVNADPFQLGPTVSRIAPWAVPARLRGGGGARPAFPRQPPPLRPQTVPAQVPDRPAPQDDGPADGQRPPTVETDEQGEPLPTTVAPGGSMPARPDSLTGSDSQPQEPDSGSSPAPPEPGVAAAVIVGIRNAPQRTADDLKRALQRVRGAGDAWAASPNNTNGARRQLADNLFQSLARLGEVVTFVSSEEVQTRSYVEQMRRLLLDVAELPDIGELIGARASIWLDRQDRSHRGVVLVGKATRVRSLGPLYETRFELPGQAGRAVSVMSRVDPADYYNAGNRVLMLGVIVQQPATTLAGYEGDEPMVIMGGYPLVLPDNEQDSEPIDQ